MDMKPLDLITHLNSAFPEKEVYKVALNNFINKVREEILNGKTLSQALIDNLSENSNYVYEVSTDQKTGALKSVFFAHKKSIELYNRYPTVLCLDATLGRTKVGGDFKLAVNIFYLLLNQQTIKNDIFL